MCIRRPNNSDNVTSHLAARAAVLQDYVTSLMDVVINPTENISTTRDPGIVYYLTIEINRFERFNQQQYTAFSLTLSLSVRGTAERKSLLKFVL